MKTAIVTGASSGIGRASAEALAKAGFTVFGTSRKPGRTLPAGIEMLTCDVTDEASVKALVDTVLERAGRIDVVVNNAGVGLLGGAEESSISQVQALFDVNLFGVLRMTNAVLPTMRMQRQGRIINVSSGLGFAPAPYSAHYAATKHALEGYSESLDHEIRAFNVRVSLIEPAYVRSPFDQNSLEPDRKLPEYDEARSRVLGFVQDVMPTADTPEMVAEAVLKAATDKDQKRRYTVGEVAGQISLLRRLMPAKIFDKALRQQLRLPA
ncbi:short-chain dehydrogenase [Devosia sp. Leaf420]|uniref:oxidoreductase n=1 Tax=Devosia sp. Leaf420 TaxID=1736374 RepID=UPI000713686C|nr:oxidoreductase [Devosia sp. Leaf420]KQT44176.1 short-chain dehydrogenase [Devosia sp. Leaf420]